MGDALIGAAISNPQCQESSSPQIQFVHSLLSLCRGEFVVIFVRTEKQNTFDDTTDERRRGGLPCHHKHWK